jgi:hypothetical protein
MLSLDFRDTHHDQLVQNFLIQLRFDLHVIVILRSFRHLFLSSLQAMSLERPKFKHFITIEFQVNFQLFGYPTIKHKSLQHDNQMLWISFKPFILHKLRFLLALSTYQVIDYMVSEEHIKAGI